MVFSTLLLTANNVRAQSEGQSIKQHPNSNTQMLPDRLGEHWQAIGPERIFNAKQASALPDAEVNSEYGLQRIVNRLYISGNVRAKIEIFEMNFISGAYGLFTFNRGHLKPGSHEFYERHYLVRISNYPAGASLDRSLVEAIKSNLIGEVGQFPVLPSHLPERDKIGESEIYMLGPLALGKMNNFSSLKDIITFDGGVEIVTADYRNGDGRMGLMIIEYHTPQSASKGQDQIQTYFNNLPQQEKDRQILKRIGNYVVEAVNIEDMKAADDIVSQIKYEAKVYWAGRKIGDIPLEFRPPDPVAIEEAKRTTEVLLRSFYWIGAMLLSAILLGIIAGGSVFYWNRYRRRKLGLDNMFSDAGGTLRLNLDDYLLSTDDPQISTDGPQIKQIGKGDGHR